MHIVKAGALYFCLVFAVGSLIGPIRELWLIPRLGRTLGIVVEAPLLLLAMALAASWASRSLRIPATVASRAGMGMIALGLLLVVELTMAMVFSGMSVNAYLASFGTPFGAISLLLFLLFAAMPMLIRRSQPY
jgi:hypothetical protein